MKLTRPKAVILFILILVLAKLSEPGLEKEPKPEHELIWIEKGRIIAEEGFMDLSREEREKLIQKL